VPSPIPHFKASVWKLRGITCMFSISNRCLKKSIMKAVQIKSHGDPLDVLEVVDVPEPKAPGVNEALIGIELAALTKYDLLSI
jgi:hypothetical protein